MEGRPDPEGLSAAAGHESGPGATGAPANGPGEDAPATVPAGTGPAANGPGNELDAGPVTDDPETDDSAGRPAGPGSAADPPATGHPAVDAALAEVARLADAPPATQVPALQAAHRVLRETLASIDEQ